MPSPACYYLWGDIGTGGFPGDFPRKKRQKTHFLPSPPTNEFFAAPLLSKHAIFSLA